MIVIAVLLCLDLKYQRNIKGKEDIVEQHEIVRYLRDELTKYRDGFDILMEYFDSISDEEKQKVHERLKEIGL